MFDCTCHRSAVCIPLLRCHHPRPRYVRFPDQFNSRVSFICVLTFPAISPRLEWWCKTGKLKDIKHSSNFICNVRILRLDNLFFCIWKLHRVHKMQLISQIKKKNDGKNIFRYVPRMQISISCELTGFMSISWSIVNDSEGSIDSSQSIGSSFTNSSKFNSVCKRGGKIWIGKITIKLLLHSSRTVQFSQRPVYKCRF